MSEAGEHEQTGTIVAVLGNNNYSVRVEVAEQEREIRCHLSGKMRRFKINVIPGDTVRIVLPPPYDIGRIIYRER